MALTTARWDARVAPHISVVVLVLVVARLMVLGADLMWAVALGDATLADHRPPDRLPFAAAPQRDWPNPMVLAQVLLSTVHRIPVGLALLHVMLVGATLSVVVRDCLRVGASNGRTAVAVSTAAIGSAGAIGIARLPVLSLLPFVILVYLLRSGRGAKGGMVWWVVPLIAVWSNLHGAVLAGVAVVAVFAVLAPNAGHTKIRIGVVVASVAALFLNPEGWQTWHYFAGALSNEAALRGSELWAAPALGNPLDVALVLSGTVLMTMTWGRRVALWEWVSVAGLVVGTILAARNGVFLLLFLAPLAARPRTTTGSRSVEWSGRLAVGPRSVLALTVVAAIGSTGLLLLRRDALGAPGAGSVSEVRAMADGRPVLADEPLAETLAQAGVQVWASNPLDAFTRETQSEYLDFISDGVIPPAAEVETAAVASRLSEKLQAQGWAVLSRVGDTVVLRAPSCGRGRCSVLPGGR
jgi:hypothetical protein